MGQLTPNGPKFGGCSFAPHFFWILGLGELPIDRPDPGTYYYGYRNIVSIKESSQFSDNAGFRYIDRYLMYVGHVSIWSRCCSTCRTHMIQTKKKQKIMSLVSWWLLYVKPIAICTENRFLKYVYIITTLSLKCMYLMWSRCLGIRER